MRYIAIKEGISNVSILHGAWDSSDGGSASKSMNTLISKFV